MPEKIAGLDGRRGLSCRVYINGVHANLNLDRLKSLCENSKSRRLCSASLQAGTLESSGQRHSCPEPVDSISQAWTEIHRLKSVLLKSPSGTGRNAALK